MVIRLAENIPLQRKILNALVSLKGTLDFYFQINDFYQKIQRKELFDNNVFTRARTAISVYLANKVKLKCHFRAEL
jgi:hypothetical protein